MTQKQIVLIGAFLLITIASYCQSADVTFRVRKKSNEPIMVNWLKLEYLNTGQPYRMLLSTQTMKVAVYDSMVCLNMDCKKYTAGVDKDEYLLFGKDKPGRGYIVFYSKHRKTGEWWQSSVRPVDFIDENSVVAK